LKDTITILQYLAENIICIYVPIAIEVGLKHNSMLLMVGQRFIFCIGQIFDFITSLKVRHYFSLL